MLRISCCAAPSSPPPGLATILAAKGFFNPSNLGDDPELIDLARVCYNEQKERAIAKLKRHGFSVESDSPAPISLLGVRGPQPQTAPALSVCNPRTQPPRMVLMGHAGPIPPVGCQRGA